MDTSAREFVIGLEILESVPGVERGQVGALGRQAASTLHITAGGEPKTVSALLLHLVAGLHRLPVRLPGLRVCRVHLSTATAEVVVRDADGDRPETRLAVNVILLRGDPAGGEEKQE